MPLSKERMPPKENLAILKKLKENYPTTISAAKALRTRKAISNTNDYLANLETAEQIYNGADSVLMNVNDILDNIIEKVTYAANGTQHDEDEEILAQTVETFADEIVRLFNTDIAERRIFGGVNNDTTVFKIENVAAKRRLPTTELI